MLANSQCPPEKRLGSINFVSTPIEATQILEIDGHGRIFVPEPALGIIECLQIELLGAIVLAKMLAEPGQLLHTRSDHFVIMSLFKGAERMPKRIFGCRILVLLFERPAQSPV